MLVTRRMDQIAEAAAAAAQRPGDRWSALTDMLTTLVSGQAADDFLGEARVAVADHPDVIASSERADRRAGPAAGRRPRGGPPARRRHDA